MLCLMQLGQPWLAGQKVLCAVLLAASLALKASGQEAVQVRSSNSWPHCCKCC